MMSTCVDGLVKIGKTQEDFVCDSPSMAAAIVCGHNQNGWNIWKNSDGQSIDIYRHKRKTE